MLGHHSFVGQACEGVDPDARVGEDGLRHAEPMQLRFFTTSQPNATRPVERQRTPLRVRTAGPHQRLKAGKPAGPN